MKRQVEFDHTSKKVVSINLDASFFFERALKMLDRRQYEKALKYFRFATEKDPSNPINHCNLAGLLSEMGKFQESNDILECVVREIDPNLTECWFYLANNATNMEEFELAEEYLLEYLGRDPEGEFAEEAEELLMLISYELGRPAKEVVPLFGEAYVQKHESARQLLETGMFVQATEMLQEIIEEHSDFLPARNNLALAYYYMGQMDSAFRTVSEVLEMEEDNIHALCNLAVLCSHIGKNEEYEQLIEMLRNLIPLQKDQAYKLATTMGILGEHEVAYELFIRIARLEDRPDAALYHAAAIASYRVGKLDRARAFWHKAKQLAPDSEVPSFFINALDGEDPSLHYASYQMQLPFEEQLLRTPITDTKQLQKQVKESPLIRSSLLWGLEHGEEDTKLQVIYALGMIEDAESERALRSFLMSPDEPDWLKEIAILQIKKMNPDASLSAILQGSVRSDHPDEDADLSGQVWKICLPHLKEMGELIVMAMEDFWRAWSVQPKSQILLQSARKLEVWAAALEYWVSNQLDRPLSKTHVAQKYGISPSSITKAIKEFDKYPIN
ncbi:hypothetical protein SAMN04487866_102226 [Thermoactinomyces sp. DSM 45891]|uniref:tetratricopeptide repeat protein n=1 Tax=Thermoactinomyces sp. DSM 45891 TaxID=1761907 RepID=UPI000913E008|nr:hypothetical protein [Thermoactinomyces sp. DSM 45891]SFX22214.1 hypothetical protein SAMN04487866_102226 [Thermoactinomyces sp. DSM 45891]